MAHARSKPLAILLCGETWIVVQLLYHDMTFLDADSLLC